MSHPIPPKPDSEPDPSNTGLGTPVNRSDDDPTHVVGYNTSVPAGSGISAAPTLGTHLSPTGTDYDEPEVDRGLPTPGRHEYLTPMSTTAPDEPADLLTQEKDEFGGMKIGAALLGWLTTVGTIVVLAAVLAAVASGMNLNRNTSTADLTGVGLGAAITLLVIAFLGYLAGGYVAGRMARFHGFRQGLAVWLWGLLIAIALSITAAIVGDQSTILVQANLPQIPFTSSGFTWQAILALVAVLLVTFLGAILGGLLGMRFHRRIDRFAAANTTTT